MKDSPKGALCRLLGEAVADDVDGWEIRNHAADAALRLTLRDGSEWWLTITRADPSPAGEYYCTACHARVASRSAIDLHRARLCPALHGGER
jgi:hypothetical protein